MSGRNPAQFRSIVTEVVYGNVTASIASVAAQTTSATQTISAPGAAIGDFVELTCSLVQTAGLIMTGEVTAADTVTVKLTNPTVGAIVPVASATYYAIVYKRQPNVLI